MDRQNTGSADSLRDKARLLKEGKLVPRHVEYDAQNPTLRGRIIGKVLEKPDIKIGELIQIISIERGYKKDAVAKELMALQDEGVIGLMESQKRSNLLLYMGAPDSSWFSASLAIIAVSIALIVIPQLFSYPSIFSLPIQILRYFFGGLFVLFLPGYSLMQALYATRTPFDDLTKYALSFVMSFAIVILISLIVGISPIGLETLQITSVLAIFTVIMLSIAMKQKYDYYQISHHFD